MSQNEVRRLVAEFRDMLTAAIDGGLEKLSLSKIFPKGCCDDSSALLAAFLTDNGHPGALRVEGEESRYDGDLGTHVWLSLDGLLIDITGSQFNEYGYSQPEILVARESEFLSDFDVDVEPEIADFREKFSGPHDGARKALARFSAVYDHVMTYRKV